MPAPSTAASELPSLRWEASTAASSATSPNCNLYLLDTLKITHRVQHTFLLQAKTAIAPHCLARLLLLSHPEAGLNGLAWPALPCPARYGT